MGGKAARLHPKVDSVSAALQAVGAAVAAGMAAMEGEGDLMGCQASQGMPGAGTRNLGRSKQRCLKVE